jgi:hypothetical protein
MKSISKQLLSCASVLALGAVGLFGAVNHAQNKTAGHDQFWSDVETVLAMTPAQKDQTQTAFDQAHQAALPIRKELRDTTQALKAAIKSDNTDQIQRLSTTEGQEIGQLISIRSGVMAKVYKSLTPDQRTKADALQKMMRRGLRHEAMGAGSRMAS